MNHSLINGYRNTFLKVRFLTINEAYETGVEILIYRCDNQLDGIELIPESLKFDLSLK